MKTIFVLIAGSLLLASCAKQPGTTGPHATVVLKDGSQVAGIVSSSSASEVILAGDDKTTHDIPTAQVRSLNYDDVPVAAPTEPAASNAPAPVNAPASQNPPAPAVAFNRFRQPDAVHDNHFHPEPEAIRSRSLLLPAGTQVSVRSEETINSSTAVEGQTYAAEIAGDVMDGEGAVVLPRGSNAKIVIRSDSRGNRFRGTSDLVLDLASVSVGGRQYALSTVDLAKSGKVGFGGNKRTAEYTGGGAALGAIIGAIAGHGRGAAIGAASGAGAGAITQLATKGGSVRVPVESILTFRLDRSLRVTAAR